jgi:hypothetical protein
MILGGWGFSWGCVGLDIYNMCAKTTNLTRLHTGYQSGQPTTPHSQTLRSRSPRFPSHPSLPKLPQSPNRKLTTIGPSPSLTLPFSVHGTLYPPTAVFPLPGYPRPDQTCSRCGIFHPHSTCNRQTVELKDNIQGTVVLGDYI